MTQWYPVFPKVFIILLNGVVREVLLEVCGPQEAQHVLGWAAVEHNISVYEENSRIAGLKII